MMELGAAPGPAPGTPFSFHMGLAEAVRTTLRRDPSIQIQEQQVKFSQGAVQQEEGAFDYNLDTAFSQGLVNGPRTELERLSLAGKTNFLYSTTELSDQRASVTRQFRSGPRVSTGIELNRLRDNLGSETVNRANVNFILTVPLLKHFGAASTAAGERAARVNKEGAVLEMRFVAGQRILNTATAYWECLGAEANLETIRASEARSRALLERVNQLVAVGEVPRAELRQTEADLAQKTADLKAGEQRFVQARQRFGLALGLAGPELATVPLPQADWPLVETNSVLNFTGQPMIERSLNRRADYQAALKGEESAAILERGARRDLKPQLDLTLEVGYAGLSEGGSLERFYNSIDPRPVHGPNAMASLRLLIPFENRSAKGLLAQREALSKQAALRQQDLARMIGSAIRVAFSDLEMSGQEVLRSGEAGELYRQTVENEREKLRIGTSTIIDVITLADRLDSAQIRATDAMIKYATALARIRYETGLLPAASEGAAVISVDDLTKLPRQLDFDSTGPAPSKPKPTP